MELDLKTKLLRTYCFVDNEYLDLYCNLMTTTEANHESTQIHHIIPKFYFKCLGINIDNTKANTIELSYINHVLAHYYLFFCTEGLIKESSALAFSLMTQSSIDSFDIANFLNQDKIDTIAEFSSHLISIPIYCVETNQKYDSARSAWKDTGIDWSSISKCCKGRKRTAGGYHWIYYDDFVNHIKPEYIGNYSTKNKNDNFIWEKNPVICLETQKQYSSIAEAAKDTGLSMSCISDVVRHKYYTAGGYHWQSLNEYNQGISVDITKSKTKKVLCIETNIVYDSVRKASEAINKNKDSIAKVCRGERLTCGGYHWKYI